MATLRHKGRVLQNGGLLRIITPCLGILWRYSSSVVVKRRPNRRRQPRPGSPHPLNSLRKRRNLPRKQKPERSPLPITGESSFHGRAAVENELSPDVPTEEECKAALNSMSEFANALESNR